MKQVSESPYWKLLLQAHVKEACLEDHSVQVFELWAQVLVKVRS